MHLINPYVLILTGMMFEIVGALFLAMESFGTNRISNTMSIIERISKWGKKSLGRLFLLGLPFNSLLIIGIIVKNDTLIGLTLPMMILWLMSTILIDHPTQLKNWLLRRTNERRISPLGFILLLIGNVFQAVSVIWQMTTK